jgi:hypothetical protein
MDLVISRLEQSVLPLSTRGSAVRNEVEMLYKQELTIFQCLLLNCNILSLYLMVGKLKKTEKSVPHHCGCLMSHLVTLFHRVFILCFGTI